jgi:LysM repeat protein
VILIPLVVSGLVVLHESNTASACAMPYMAKRGDSWWSIAEKHDLSLNRVLKLNKAKPSTEIFVGDPVCVAAETIKPKPESVRYSHKEVIQIIREEWPDELEERAIQIAWRESKFNPRAIGIPNDCCYGLFQIYYRWHKGWLPSVGVDNASQLLDPRLNARAAYRMYQRNSGWGPWQ